MTWLSHRGDRDGYCSESPSVAGFKSLSDESEDLGHQTLPLYSTPRGLNQGSSTIGFVVCQTSTAFWNFPKQPNLCTGVPLAGEPFRLKPKDAAERIFSEQERLEA